jgi:long-chain acyl-CoA synthetase
MSNQYSIMGNVINMFLERASRYGSREVFRFTKGDSRIYESISWEDLVIETQKASQALISLGVERGENVGIFSENRPEWMISDLGIIGTRSVVVPFYATSSKQQLKYIVDETRMKLIFAGNQEQFEKALWLFENTETLKKVIVFDPVIGLDDDRCISWQKFMKLDDEKLFASELNQRILEIQPEDLITIIYTSGTTGESKGAMLTHATFMHTFKIHDERLDVRDSDVSVCFLPLSHVFERSWTYYIIHCGATNVFIDNPREIIKQLPVIKPTVMCTVPRFFEKTYEGIQSELLKWSAIKKNIFNWSVKTGIKYSEYLSKDKNPPFGLIIKQSIADKLVLKKLRNIFGGNIRFMPCAGAAINPFLLRFFHGAGIFINYGYGATETSATVSCFRSDRYDFDTCGTIMPGFEVKISNEGEILIKGENVFKGYYNKPEETGKTLLDGWYYSGDQGYITSNGDLIMTDRIKDLIKTSVGKYVSPQKIELALGQDPFIEQVIAIGDNRKYITALIVPSFAWLKKEAEKMGLNSPDNSELVVRKEIIDFYAGRISLIQEEFTSYEKVVRFKLLPEPFSIQNGMLTNTLKVRRNKLIEEFKNDIEKMYLAG